MCLIFWLGKPDRHVHVYTTQAQRDHHAGTLGCGPVCTVSEGLYMYIHNYVVWYFFDVGYRV